MDGQSHPGNGVAAPGRRSHLCHGVAAPRLSPAGKRTGGALSNARARQKAPRYRHGACDAVPMGIRAGMTPAPLCWPYRAATRVMGTARLAALALACPSKVRASCRALPCAMA